MECGVKTHITLLCKQLAESLMSKTTDFWWRTCLNSGLMVGFCTCLEKFIGYACFVVCKDCSSRWIFRVSRGYRSLPGRANKRA